MKILSLFALHHVVPNLYVVIFLSLCCMEKCCVMILHNVVFCVPWDKIKKEVRNDTWLSKWQNFHLYNIPSFFFFCTWETSAENSISGIFSVCVRKTIEHSNTDLTKLFKKIHNYICLFVNFAMMPMYSIKNLLAIRGLKVHFQQCSHLWQNLLSVVGLLLLVCYRATVCLTLISNGSQCVSQSSWRSPQIF